MHFPNETPLEDVLKYIRSATAGPDGEGIAIHVDPAGLERVDKSLKYPVTIDLTGVPLRRTLQLLADQLEMGYGIKDGMVTIIAADFSRQNCARAPCGGARTLPRNVPAPAHGRTGRTGRAHRGRTGEIEPAIESHRGSDQTVPLDPDAPGHVPVCASPQRTSAMIGLSPRGVAGLAFV